MSTRKENARTIQKSAALPCDNLIWLGCREVAQTLGQFKTVHALGCTAGKTACMLAACILDSFRTRL